MQRKQQYVQDQNESDGYTNGSIASSKKSRAKKSPVKRGLIQNKSVKVLETEEFSDYQKRINALGLGTGSTKYNQGLSNTLRQTQDTIERASSTFNIEGIDYAGLSRENERLKTNILVLQKDINSQTDYQLQIDALKRKNIDLNEEIQLFKSENMALKNSQAIYTAENDNFKVQQHKADCDHDHSHDEIIKLQS